MALTPEEEAYLKAKVAYEKAQEALTKKRVEKQVAMEAAIASVNEAKDAEIATLETAANDAKTSLDAVK